MKNTNEIASFQNFEEFYQDYLRNHSNKVNRRIHYIGTTIALIIILITLFSKHFHLFLYAPIVGIACSWIGHYVFEPNLPFSLKFMFYRVLANLYLWYEISFRDKPF